MLINKLKSDRLKFFKERNESAFAKAGYNVLGVLIGDATKESKEPTDEKVIALIKKFIENCKICKESAKDEISKYMSEKEIKVLTEYLPKQLTEDEIRNIINVVFIDSDSKDIGSIMKYFKTNFSGQYDGKLVSEILKKG